MKKIEFSHKIKRLTNAFKPKQDFSYKYKPFSLKNRTRSFVINRNKQISAVLVVVFLIFLSYLVTNTLTGFVTYQKTMETKLNETENMLAEKENELIVMAAEKNRCENDLLESETEAVLYKNKLSESESYLVRCESERDELQTYSNELNALLSVCETERENLSTSYKEISTKFYELVKKTSADICCRPGIEIANWVIADNRLVCSGEYTVNCSSGKTNY